MPDLVRPLYTRLERCLLLVSQELSTFQGRTASREIGGIKRVGWTNALVTPIFFCMSNMPFQAHLSVLVCLCISVLSTVALPSAPAPQISTQSYKWQNVRIGGGGGFVPGIIFNPSQKGLAYARTDIGGVYKLNEDDSWTPLVDFADNDHWDYWGSDAIATDPVDPDRLYIVSCS
jgi:hypothetical protein